MYSEYIAALSKEYSERGYYNQEFCFSDFIKIFNIEITDKSNKAKVEFYRKAINWNIPNETIYREKIMSDEEYGILVNRIPQY